MPEPFTVPDDRIVLLDTLRGFGVLGILLMNILGFGLLSPAYSHPGFDIQQIGGADYWAWLLVELFGEGSMRGLFSLLFGAGIVLFTTGKQGKSAALHFRRTGWLLLFGLLDAYLLLWFGDILVCYAICGFLLYPLRNLRARSLLLLAALVALFATSTHALMHWGLSQGEAAAQLMATAADPAALSEETLNAAREWQSFSADYHPNAAAQAAEQAARGASYASAFAWNAPQANGMLFFVLPLFLIWDALMMMLLGMALFKYGALSGGLSQRCTGLLAVCGLGIGLAVNGAEVWIATRDELALISVFAQLKWSYHLGRIAMTLGYVGLFAWLLQKEFFKSALARIAAVGRMALSNYLMHSLIALLLFTGAGLGLIGTLTRAELYAVVALIWLLQLWLSPRWLDSHRFGPLEFLWRRLTYGKRPGG